MEFIKLEHLPETFHLSCFLHKFSADVRRHAHQDICLHKPPFRLAVLLLEQGIDRIAPLINPFKSPRQHGEIILVDIPQKLCVTRKNKFCFFHGFLQFMNGMNILNRRAAAMITNAIATDHFVIILGPFQSEFYILHRRLMKPCSIFRRKADSIYLTAIAALPFKHRRIQPRPHEHIRIHTAFFQNLGQNRVMSEAVHVGTNLCHPAKTTLQVTLPIQPVPHKSFSAGQDTVRLNKPPSRNLPAAFLHSLFNFFKHFRQNSLNPFEKSSGCRSESEILKLPHALQSRSIGSLHLLHTFFPVPEPDGVDMRVSDHVQFFLFH